MKNTIEYYIRENEKLIYSLINKYSSYSVKEDLYQASMVGLIEAYKRFDETRGVKFSTYAYPYIIGEIKKYVRESHSLKVSRDLINLYYKINMASEALTNKMGRIPSDDELSLFLEIDKQKIIEAREACYFVKSLDEPINSDDEKDITITDMIPSVSGIDKNDLIWLRDELNSLSDEERTLINMRYMKNKTQQEVANIMGISQVQVSRNEQRVLTKMRSFM